jgi:hypothetical protein
MIERTLKKLREKLSYECDYVRIALIKKAIISVEEFKQLSDRCKFSSDKISAFLMDETTTLCDTLDAV